LSKILNAFVHKRPAQISKLEFDELIVRLTFNFKNFAGHIVTQWHPESGINPEELGSYLEGDMLLPAANQGRNGLIPTEYRWTNGTIPYKIAGTFSRLQFIKTK
jgi:hypothetical protein